MLFTKKEIIRIFIPLLIEQFLTISIGMIDTMMVASAGEAAISGVALVDTINYLIILVFGALATGGAVVISQFIGKKDMENSALASKLLVWVVFVVSVVLTFVSVFFRKAILDTVFGSIDDNVMSNALVYFEYTALSYPFFAVYGAVSAIFRSVGNTKISLEVSVIQNIINVAGNAVLILGYGMGAKGAAVATLASRIVGALIMMVCLHNRNNTIRIDNILKTKFDFSIIKKMCAIGIPNGLESGMFQFGKVITQSLVATLATAHIAANSAGNSITSIQYVIGNAVGMTMITVVGRCVGAGEKELARKYTVMLLKIQYLLMIILDVAMIVFAKQIVSLYNLSEEAFNITVMLLIMHSVLNCTIWPMSFTLPYPFRAANDVRYTMVIGIASMWIARVGMSYVLCKGFNMGVEGIWYAMFTDWVVRAVIFAVRFKHGTWLTKYKDAEA